MLVVRQQQPRFRKLYVLLSLILFLSLFNTILVPAFATTTVKSSNPDGWVPANVRANATVAITTAQPRSGDGSLEFTTNTITSGQDKADYEKVWGVTPGRTLGNLSALSYDFYRDSSSTTAAHFAPVLRLYYLNSSGQSGLLIWEPIYNGYGAVVTDTWISADILGGNFWMRAFDPGRTIDDYNVSLAEWMANADEEGSPIDDDADSDAPHVLGPDTYIIGVNVGVGSGWGATFRGYVDNVLLQFGSDEVSANFEPETPCTTVCYVNAATGNDSFGGDTPTSAKKTIQAAIDVVDPGGTVRVYPGSYSETASNRTLFNGSGPYQFGLFIGQAKSGITVQGVDDTDAPITAFGDVLATVNTNATNNFGYSGIFVEGDNVTIAGLRIGPNAAGQNKTIEVIGDNFSLKNSDIAVPQGSVYFNDWRFDTVTNTSHVQAYRLEGNNFQDGVSLDLASGAGFSGPVSGRVITGNHFTNSYSWPSISFNGSNTGVPWFIYSVGGAIIQGNSFTNTAGDGQFIRARGDYDNSQFDWTAYWQDNDFNKAVIVGPNPPADVRTYSYPSGAYTFNNVRRISAVIQPELDHALAGDTVLVAPGVYAESPNITQSLTLQAEAGRDVTTIVLQSGPTYLGALTIAGANVTVDGFTITGFDAAGSGLASSNIFVTTAPSNVVISNNRLRVGAIGAGSNGDDGMGLITTYSETSDVANLTVAGNIFEPVNLAGGRAFYINPGVDNFTFRQNSITGKFTDTAITQAKNGLVEENIVTGVRPAGSPSAGLGTWGYPDPTVWGRTIFRHNEISAVDNAITINETENVLVEGNKFSQNGRSVWIQTFGLPFDNATISIHRNSIVGSATLGVANDVPTAGVVDATLNWWSSPAGPTHTGNVGGTGDSVSDAIAFSPWLCDGTDTSPAIGFQPSLTPLCAIPSRLIFTTQPGDGIVNDPLTTQPVVRAEDASGNLGINFNGAVSLALEPVGATLKGTNPVNAVNGVATFSGLAVDTSGIYTLAASAAGFTGVTSNSFAIQANINDDVNIFLPLIVKNH